MKNHLLPEGFRDSLPDLAFKEFRIVSDFINIMLDNKYKIVRPPLMEFENSLFSLSNNLNNTDSFRVLDPQSQKIMGLRSDITNQIARIASGSLKTMQRPLRLCYFGEILKVKNSQLNISRQSTQIGAEMIGISDQKLELEVINMITKILNEFDISNFTFSLSMPSLIKSLCKDFNLSTEETKSLTNSYENKNLSEIKNISKKVYDISSTLLQAVGKINENYRILENEMFPPYTQIEINKFLKSIKNFLPISKKISLILDPIELDKTGYHNGIMFKVYSEDLNELFSGGSYKVNNENCIGFSALVENIIKEYSLIKN